MFDYTPVVISTWVLSSFKNAKIISLLVILEFLTLWIECINSITRLVQTFKGQSNLLVNDFTFSKLNSINPLSYVQDMALGGLENISQCTATSCAFENSLTLVLTILIVILLIFHHYSSYLNYKQYQINDITHSSEGKTSKALEILNLLTINLLDLIFKVFSIFLFFVFFNKIFVGLYFKTDYAYVVISAIFISIFLACYIYQVKYIILLLRVDHKDSLHYDSFSQNYDLLLLFLKIIITFNKNLLLINSIDEYNRHILFLDYCVVFCIFNFTIKMILTIFNDKNLTIVTNFNLNLLRLYLTIHVSIYIILYSFFNFIKVYDIVITNIVVIFISLLLLSYLNDKIYSLIYTDEKVLYQLIYLMVLYLAKEEENLEYDSESEKIKSLHMYLCSGKENEKNYKCEICLYYKNLSLTKENESFYEINPQLTKMKLMGKMIEYINKHILPSLSQEEIDFFNMIDLLYNYSLTQIDHSMPHFKVIYQNKSVIDKNKLRKNSFYYNLEFYYLKINRQSENNLKKFRVIKRYDSSLHSLTRTVDIISEVILTLESKVKKDLYPQTSELYSHKLKIIENLSDIHDQSNVYKDIFSFVMCRFVFENAFNFELTEVVKNLMSSDDFDSRIDLIDDHYNKDSLLIINYKVDQDSLIVTRASKKFSPLQGKFFEEIFPSNFRSIGRAKFINAIQSNNDSFTFEYLIDTQDDFVKNLKLECKIHRSFDLQDIFIFASFKVSQEDILVFETPNNIDLATNRKYFDIHKSMLTCFSEYLEKVIFVTPKLLNFLSGLSIKKKYISFTDIFSAKTSDFDKKKPYQGKNEKIPEGKEFNLDYTILYKNFFQEIDNILDSIENEELREKMDEIKTVVKNQEVLSVRISELYTMNKNENYSYFVYNLTVQMKRINNNKSGNRYYNFLNSVVRSKQFVNNLLEHAKKFGKSSKGKAGGFNFIEGLVEAKSIQDDELMDLELENNSQISKPFQSKGTAITALKSNNIASILPGRKGDSLSSGSMAHYTIITLLINVCLIVYCVIFMVNGFSNNSKMTQLNEIRTQFNSFERLFYQTSLSLFYNVGVFKENTIDSGLHNNDYWNKFNTVGLSISMGDYGNRELNVKGGLLNTKMSDMLNYIYSSSFKETMDGILSFNTNQKSITFLDNEMKLANQYTPFLESILNFINYAKSVTFPSMSTMIYIYNYDLLSGAYNFNSVKNKTFSEVQKAVYEMIFNYPNYLNNMNKIDKELTQLFDDEIKSIFSLNFYLSVVLIGLHAFLLIISLSIINYLKRTTYDSNYIFSKLVTGDWSKYLETKTRILKDMLKFYKRDPLKCSNKIRRDQSEAARVAREHQKEQSKNLNNQIEQKEALKMENQTFDAEVGIENLISPLMRVLIYLFTFYLIYAIGFIILFQDSENDINLSSDYQSTYLKVDKGVMNVVMLLQSILFSNQTDSNLLKFLSNNTNFDSDPEYKRGYIINLVEESKLYGFYLSKLEKSYSKFEVVNTGADMYSDCEYLYNNIKDDVFEITKSFYNENELISNLIKLCKYYSVMQKKNFKNIIEEINYVTMKLVKQYEFSYGNYANMKELNDNTEFFDDFTVNLMIFRPLQSHIINNQIETIVTNSENYFLICIIAFMIGNILVECIIFFVINRKLIARVLVINEEIRCLTLCITA
jgi:hypothetical protein